MWRTKNWESNNVFLKEIPSLTHLNIGKSKSYLYLHYYPLPLNFLIIFCYTFDQILILLWIVVYGREKEHGKERKKRDKWKLSAFILFEVVGFTSNQSNPNFLQPTVAWVLRSDAADASSHVHRARENEFQPKQYLCYKQSIHKADYVSIMWST